jgi:hypothetical protein
MTPYILDERGDLAFFASSSLLQNERISAHLHFIGGFPLKKSPTLLDRPSTGWHSSCYSPAGCARALHKNN